MSQKSASRSPQPPRVREKILALYSGKPRLRLTPVEIARRTGSKNDQLQLIVDSLRQLVRERHMVRLKKNHYALPGSENLASGRVHAHPDGFGFLILDDKAAEDLYLSRREMRRVMHGDRVMVRVERNKRGGIEAHIVQVIERANQRLLGTYEEIDGKGYLVPMDPRIGPAIPLTRRADRPGAGKIIAAQISHYGTASSPPAAEIVKIIGNPDDPEVQVQSVVFRYGLPTSFPPEVQHEAEECPLAIDAEEIANRTDLRHLPIVTIDGELARDFDDAIHVRRANRNYELYVSIADVAFYVEPGSALDREAYARGTSVYFPDRAIPMLPEALSNGICSLNPNENRLTKTVRIELDSTGEVVNSRFFNSVIRSHERMTYTNVRRILVNGDQETMRRYEHLIEQFRLMEELALLIFKKRKTRGNLDFDLPEAEIILDIQGMPENIVRAERNIAHRIIEEFMIAANEAVARHLKEQDIPLLYRVHEAPEKESLEALAPFLLSLGYRIRFNREKIAPRDIQTLLESARGKPEERVLNRVLLRSMKQALYQPENIGHFGLASVCYTHFTSPIRRYPDLIVHRMLERAIRGKKLRAPEREDFSLYLSQAGKDTSTRERNAMDAEREMVDLKKTQFMIDKIGQEFGGFITSLANFGFFVELDSYFVEGLVKIASLTDDDYYYFEKQYVIKGLRHGRQFRLGDNVRVKVTRINAFRSEIDFELIYS